MLYKHKKLFCGLFILMFVPLLVACTPESFALRILLVNPAQETGSPPAFVTVDGERVTQDWVNIQDAFEAAPAGHTIYLTSGIYYLNRTVVVENFTGSLQGENRDEVVIRAIRSDDGSGFVGYNDPAEPPFFGAPHFMFVIKTAGQATITNLTMEVLDPQPSDEWTVWFYNPETFGPKAYTDRRAPYMLSNALYGFLRIHPMLDADQANNHITVKHCVFSGAVGDAPNGSNVHFGVLSNPGYNNILPRPTTVIFNDNIVRNVAYVGVESITYESDMDFIATNNHFIGGERLVWAWGNSGSGRIEIRDNTSTGAFWHPGSYEFPDDPAETGTYTPFAAEDWRNANYNIIIADNVLDTPPDNPYE